MFWEESRSELLKEPTGTIGALTQVANVGYVFPCLRIVITRLSSEGDPMVSHGIAGSNSYGWITCPIYFVNRCTTAFVAFRAGWFVCREQSCRVESPHLVMHQGHAWAPAVGAIRLCRRQSCPRAWLSAVPRAAPTARAWEDTSGTEMSPNLSQHLETCRGLARAQLLRCLWLSPVLRQCPFLAYLCI